MSPLAGRGPLHTYRSYHAAVLALQKVAVIYERTNRLRILEVHPQPDAR